MSEYPNLQVQFELGVTAILDSWIALRMAVQNQWGGPYSQSKVETLRQNIIYNFSYINNEKISAKYSLRNNPIKDLYDFEEYLQNTLEDEFCIILEDDSEQQVTSDIYTLYKHCKCGEYEVVKRILDNLRRKMDNMIGNIRKQTKNVNRTVAKEECNDMDVDLEEDVIKPNETNAASCFIMDQNNSLFSSSFRSNETNSPSKNKYELRSRGKITPIIDENGFEVISNKHKSRYKCKR